MYAQATNYAPNVTEDMRAKYLIDAMLSKIEQNPQRYYDFIGVLNQDSMRADAESALALLPTGTYIYINWHEIIAKHISTK